MIIAPAGRRRQRTPREVASVNQEPIRTGAEWHGDTSWMQVISLSGGSKSNCGDRELGHILSEARRSAEMGESYAQQLKAWSIATHNGKLVSAAAKQAVVDRDR